MNVFMPELSDEDFEKFSKLIYEQCGIYLQPLKKALLKSRLLKRLKVLNLNSFSEYYNYLMKDKSQKEFTELINVISTNKTEFFREPKHFEFLKQVLAGQYSKQHKISIWSAASSTGEEPYSIAMTISNFFNDIITKEILILATDIDTNVLKKAQQGEYDNASLENLDENYVKKYFVESSDKNKKIVCDKIKNMIKFKQLNLVKPFPFITQFDIIFCRNVMIYFDAPTQAKVVTQLYNHLKPNGYLLIGHSESLMRVKIQNLKYLAPATYQKII
ncbi:MAG TPA: protein-glutamate O-methyltransferase CheR [bacterium]|nr:protein-glutamate O-methyltransferase CheR [bacterium]HPP87609.1 protein-glutamate O-methyltransferase CheR [bacterium]